MRIRALAIRIIIQFVRDKRTLALLFLAPLLILGLMKLVFNGNTVEPDIGTVQLPASIIERLTGADANVTTFDQIHEAQLALSNGDLDAILTFDGSGKPSIQLEGSDPAVNKMVLLLLQRVMSANAAFNPTECDLFARK